MKLSGVKASLEQIHSVNFLLPGGQRVPEHFHVTEVGLISKKFIDCGGTIRNESVITMQLFVANDYDHRLSAEKLKSIIELSERGLGLDDLEVELEYQAGTIGIYGLSFDGNNFNLIPKQADCLAKDKCGIPTEKPKKQLSELQSCCTPGGSCC